MLVDKDGQFITQRQFPQLAQLSVAHTHKNISLHWPGQASIEVALPDGHTRKTVTVWRDTLAAACVDHHVNTALSNWLGKQVQLMFMDETAIRLASEKYAGPNKQVNFADGFPILITNTASLAAVNKHIALGGGTPLGMDRFRPNIVIDCDTPWAEDDWQALHIGDVILDLVKPCARCVVTSIDQTTGERKPKSALAALKHLHPSTDPDNPGVIFGMNAVPRTLGAIQVNDVAKLER